METTYDIIGMTCEHCARAVGGELSSIEGVSDVAVDIAAGTATVVSAHPLELDAVRAAIHEAGYELGRPGRLPSA